MTKSKALALYDLAMMIDDLSSYRAAADAMASLLRPPLKTGNKDLSSKAFKGMRLVKWMKCSKGHEFNGAGCKICPHCTKERWAIAGKYDTRPLPSPPHNGWATEWNREP